MLNNRKPTELNILLVFVWQKNYTSSWVLLNTILNNIINRQNVYCIKKYVCYNGFNIKNIDRGDDMDENKSVKVSLGTVICIVIILILSFALIIVYYFGFVAEENSIEKSNLDTNINNLNETISNANDDNVSTNNTVEFNQTDYVIQFDEYLLGEEYETAGNELKEESYTISFLNNNEFNIYMGFGNSVQGNYTISNNIVNCILTTARGEYSPIQEIEGKKSLLE